ncbi:MAG: T9SS type A sorting domain-containing protein [Flavobacteriales bacterium]
MTNRPAFIVCLGLALTLSSTRTHGQVFQELFESSQISSGWIKGVVSTADGGSVFDLGTHGKCKVDENGDFLWRQGPVEGTTAMSAMPDGGVVTVLNQYDYLGYDLENDSIAFRFPIVRTGGAGEVLWRKVISIHFGSWLIGDPYVEVTINTDTTGRIFLLAGSGSFYPRQEFIACLDASGSLLWSKWIDGLLQGGYVGLVAGDEEGGCFAVWKYAWNDQSESALRSRLDLCHLTANGSLEWHKRGELTSWGDASVSSIINVNGNVVIGGVVQDQGCNQPHKTFTFMVQPDGTLGWFGSYNFTGLATPAYGSWRLAGLSNGEIIGALLNPGQSNYFPVIAHLASDGTVMNSAQVIDVDTGGVDHHIDLKDMDTQDSTITLATGLVSKPGIWSLTPDLAGCMLTPVDLPVLVTSTWSSYVSDPSGTAHDAVVVLVDSTQSASAGVQFYPVDLCWFITSAPDVGMIDTQFHVSGNIVQQGTSIIAASATNGRIEVLDASGRLVATLKMNATATNELSTSGWLAGLYLLRASDVHGRLVGTARVMVE